MDGKSCSGDSNSSCTTASSGKSMSPLSSSSSSSWCSSWHVNGRAENSNTSCDVTELKARAILCMAKREMEERMRSQQRCSSAAKAPVSSSSTTASNGCVSLTTSTRETWIVDSGVFSMKRSLERFLKRRRIRTRDWSFLGHKQR